MRQSLLEPKSDHVTPSSRRSKGSLWIPGYAACSSAGLLKPLLRWVQLTFPDLEPSDLLHTLQLSLLCPDTPSLFTQAAPQAWNAHPSPFCLRAFRLSFLQSSLSATSYRKPVLNLLVTSALPPTDPNYCLIPFLFTFPRTHFFPQENVCAILCRGRPATPTGRRCAMAGLPPSCPQSPLSGEHVVIVPLSQPQSYTDAPDPPLGYGHGLQLDSLYLPLYPSCGCQRDVPKTQARPWRTAP